MGDHDVEERTYRPQAARRFLAAAAAGVFCLATIGFIVEAEPGDPGWWVFLAVPLGGAVFFARLAVTRVVADGQGVRVAGLVRGRTYPWATIDRFELSPWARRARLVTFEGKHHNLGLGNESPAEMRPGTASFAGGLVEELNEMLASRSAPAG